MRKFILLIILILFQAGRLFSFSCEPPPGCEDKTFPYLFCNSNNLPTLCSKNPYNEYHGPTHLKPMKLDGCFQYDPLSYNFEYSTTKKQYMGDVRHYIILGYDPATGKPIYGIKDDKTIYLPGTNTEITGYNIGDTIFVQYDTRELITESVTFITNQIYKDFWGDTCFNYYQFNPDMYPGTKQNADEALAMWKNICNGCVIKNESMQHCCVRMYWTKKKELFTDRGFDPEKIPAFTRLKMFPPSMEPCDYECDQLFVALNQTDEFTGNTESDPGNYKKSFFITGTVSKHDWYSLKATFMHEMGRLFGFGDQYENDSLFCDHYGSIMDGKDFTNPDRGLSSDDICMYKKMYCWTPVLRVAENQDSFDGIKVFPNPTNNNFITIQVGHKLSNNMTFEIISPIGNSVSSGEIQSNENPKTITLGNLASGAYYIVLKYDGKRDIREFVVNQ